MRYVVVSVYDRAVGAYGRPAFVRSEGEAIRGFAQEVNRVGADSIMNLHPEHFTLFFLGHWFDDTGKFVAEELPSELTNAERVMVAPPPFRG